ncbi:MAG: hypothetical protein ACK4N5_14505 [Myxococcales bacterium]
MLRTAITTGLLLALTACTSESRLVTGEFVAAEANPASVAGVRLVVAADKQSAQLVHTDGQVQPLALTPVKQEEWDLGCPSQWSSVALETFLVEPSTLRIGKLELQNAKLTAGCFSEQPQAILEGTQSGGHQSVLFDARP